MIYLTKKAMPLDDIRVVDMTHVWYGPWCTMMLSYLGAEVIRVEPPWGAIDRLSRSGVYGGVPYTFHHLNLNKKDVTINTKDPEGLALLKELISQERCTGPEHERRSHGENGTRIRCTTRSSNQTSSTQP